MKKLLLSITLIIVSIKAFSQNNLCTTNSWFEKPLAETKNYIELKASGNISNSKIDAKKTAEFELMSQIANLKGCVISKPEDYYKTKVSTENNNAMETGSYGISIFIKCSELEKIQWKIEKSETCESNNMYEHFLVAKIYKTNLSKAALYSILPGAGQFYKGDNKMGKNFLLGTGSSLGLCLGAFTLSNTYYQKMETTRDTSLRVKYKNTSNVFSNTGIVLGVTTGILWVANIANARFKKQNNRLYSGNYPLNKFEIKPAFAFNSTGISIKYNLN